MEYNDAIGCGKETNTSIRKLLSFNEGRENNQASTTLFLDYSGKECLEKKKTE